MRVRVVGYLNENQITEGLKVAKEIEPKDGVVFIKGGLSYTFTYKKKKAVSVTIRKAPKYVDLDSPKVGINITEEELLDEPLGKLGGESVRDLFTDTKDLEVENPDWNCEDKDEAGSKEDLLNLLLNLFGLDREGYEDRQEAEAEFRKDDSFKVGDRVSYQPEIKSRLARFMNSGATATIIALDDGYGEDVIKLKTDKLLNKRTDHGNDVIYVYAEDLVKI